jgi:hypothetical protein
VQLQRLLYTASPSGLARVRKLYKTCNLPIQIRIEPSFLAQADGSTSMPPTGKKTTSTPAHSEDHEVFDLNVSDTELEQDREVPDVRMLTRQRQGFVNLIELFGRLIKCFLLSALPSFQTSSLPSSYRLNFESFS